MKKKSAPAITFMLQYTDPYSEYINYTNRKNAVEIETEMTFDEERIQIEGMTEELASEIGKNIPEQSLPFREYIEYMNRNYATKENSNNGITAVFNKEYNHAPVKEIEVLKNKLDQAYNNGSLLWQGVISFDNEFLAKQGYYDKETGKVDQNAIKEVVREAMPFVFRQEGLSNSAFWWGNVHLNTGNIHVHIGISEVESAREKIYYAPRHRMERKGHFSQKTMKNLKSNIFHGLLNEETKALLLRKEQIIANLKTDLLAKALSVNQEKSESEKFYLEQTYNHLPKNKKWRFGSNSKDFSVSKFFLNKYIDSYLKNEGREEYKHFRQETLAFLMEFENAYTAKESDREYNKLRYVDGKKVVKTIETKGYQIEKIMEQREKELRERIGNRILRYFKEEPPLSDDNNIKNFSKRNQEGILEQYPDARIVKTEKSWKRDGRLVSDNLNPISVLVPVMELDENGNETGRVSEYTSESYFDIQQTIEDPEKRKMNISDLMFLSTEDLTQLIDVLKKSENNSTIITQELGIIRYALRQKVLEERRIELGINAKLLQTIQPIDTDQPFITLMKKQNTELTELVNLQLKPNWRLSLDERNRRKELSNRYIDVVQLPINKANDDLINIQMTKYETEIQLVKQVSDENIFSLLYGYDINKNNYLKELENKVSVLQLKHGIYNNNKRIETTTDEEVIKNYRRENGQKFSELKKLYTELNSSKGEFNKALNKILEWDYQRDDRAAKSISDQVQIKRTQKYSSILKSQGNSHVSKSFMSGLSKALQSSNKKNMQSLMKKIRDDEREEKEKEKERARGR